MLKPRRTHSTTWSGKSFRVLASLDVGARSQPSSTEPPCLAWTSVASHWDTPATTAADQGRVMLVGNSPPPPGAPGPSGGQGDNREPFGDRII